MCYFPKSSFTWCSFDFSLLIVVSGIMNHRQEEAGAFSAPKTLQSHYICPRDTAVVLPPRKLLLGFFTRECIFFFLLDGAYFSPMIQRLGQPEPGRLVGLFLFCKKACVQGKSLNNKFRHSGCLHTDVEWVAIAFSFLKSKCPIKCEGLFSVTFLKDTV